MISRPCCLVCQRQILTQAAHIHPDYASNGAKLLERRIALASLDSADVAGSGIRFQREVLLG